MFYMPHEFVQSKTVVEDFLEFFSREYPRPIINSGVKGNVFARFKTRDLDLLEVTCE